MEKRELLKIDLNNLLMLESPKEKKSTMNQILTFTYFLLGDNFKLNYFAKLIYVENIEKVIIILNEKKIKNAKLEYIEIDDNKINIFTANEGKKKFFSFFVFFLNFFLNRSL